MGLNNGVLEHILDSSVEATSIVDWSGGEGMFIAEGTWNGATVTLQVRTTPARSFVSMGSTGVLTEDGAVAFVAPAGVQLRAIASVAVPTDVAASILKNPRHL